MGTPTGAVTDIVGTVVPVVGAGGSQRFVVRQAGTGPVASVRVRAVSSAGGAAGRAHHQTRMDTNPSRADVVRTIIRVIYTGRTVRDVRMNTTPCPATDVNRALASVIGTDRPDRLVVGEAYARPVTGIGVAAVGVAGIAASRAHHQTGMGAETR